jgi:CheY-like chemotaxis protein
VKAAENGAEALEPLAHSRSTDPLGRRMPRMTGSELLAAVRQRDPECSSCS